MNVFLDSPGVVGSGYIGLDSVVPKNTFNVAFHLMYSTDFTAMHRDYWWEIENFSKA